jgi:outer membrane receptor protein involved in Fe transport
MKNFNDNISAINPYMAKDIKVMKGGFGAEYGERVGGIVDIYRIGREPFGTIVQFSINNMTINGKFSIPFFKKSALVAAYRQTYYDLYKSLDIASSGLAEGDKALWLNILLIQTITFAT